jgi:hypothetical protein
MPHIQHADSFWSIKFVRSQREQIHVQFVHVERERSCGLHGVGMERHAARAADRAQLSQRLDRADLIVCIHDRDQHRIRADGCAQVVGGDHTIAIHRQYCSGEAKRLELLDRVQHGVVLDRAGDDMRALAGLALRQRNTLDRQVIGLRSAAGEDDLLAAGSQHSGDSLAGLVERLERSPTEAVDARRVAEAFAEVGQHRRDNLLVDRRGRGVIQIDIAIGHEHFPCITCCVLCIGVATQHRLSPARF